MRIGARAAQADQRRRPAAPVDALNMGVHVERLAVLRLDLDRGGRRSPRGQAAQKHPRQPAVRRERVEVGIAEIVEQRAVGVERLGSARHQHADRKKVDHRHRAGRGVALGARRAGFRSPASLRSLASPGPEGRARRRAPRFRRARGRFRRRRSAPPASARSRALAPPRAATARHWRPKIRALGAAAFAARLPFRPSPAA